MRHIVVVIIVMLGYTACSQKKETKDMKPDEFEKIEKTEVEWKKELSGDEFYILRKKGTERAFSGKYNDFYEAGKYYCAGCGNYLFDSDKKFSSGCGWPSFYDVQSEKSLNYTEDTSFGMKRIEITCAACGGHMGHVFPDGPKPTRQRYCVNSVSLKFVPDSIKANK